MNMKEEKKKIVFTGGHHTSAVAVIDELNKRPFSENVQLFFVGHRYSMQREEVESAEYREIKDRNIPFYNLKAGKIYQTADLREWLRLPYGFLQAFVFLLRRRPHLIVSFGGYLAAPVVFAGWLLGVPSVTHEQTVVSGWANRFIARFAKKVFISWSQSRSYFPREKVVFTGLPLREGIFSAVSKRIAREDVRDKENPILYITGGKQGSQVINEAVDGALHELLDNFRVYHQCGPLDIDRFKQRAEKLPVRLRKKYTVQGYYGEIKVAEIYGEADVVVGRAGAHTTYELAALGIPAVLVPIPWASHNEQEKNARILEDAGIVKVLSQEDLNTESLVKNCLGRLSMDSASLGKAQRRARDLVKMDAAQKIVDELRHFLE